jgi:hypothetical protein
MEIAAVKIAEDGTGEVIIGDESGSVKLFVGKSGSSFSLPSHSSSIARIDAGKIGGGQIVIADNAPAQVMTLAKVDAPIWYTPLLIGLLISFVIAITAWFVATMPAKPTLRVAAEDQSVESLKAKQLMLHESLADVERMRQSGEVPGDAYLARLRELRGELADTEAALMKAGVSIKPETFKCPNCGGTLPLGIDKCDYCGQVVIQ